MNENKKTAFFDMDGTVIAPMFYDNGKWITGFIEYEWVKFCTRMREHAYDNCAPVKPVIDFARKLKAANWDLTLLTVVKSEPEKLAKDCWLENRAPGLFSDIVTVPNDATKMRYLKDYVTKTGIDPNNVILVEDNLLNMLEGCDLGIKALHVSHIITGTVPFDI